MSSAPLLSTFLFAPLLGAALLWLLPPAWFAGENRTGRRVALGIALASLLVSAVISIHVFKTLSLHPDNAIHFQELKPLAPSWGISYTLGVDGISAPLVLLSGITGLIAIIASWKIHGGIRAYLSLMLVLFTGVNGVFVSLDLFLFYIFWEAMLIPMYFLIAYWGGEQRRYASLKFFLYTMAGSLLMLLAMLAMYYSIPERGLLVRVSSIEAPDGKWSRCESMTPLYWKSYYGDKYGDLHSEAGDALMHMKRDTPALHGLPLLVPGDTGLSSFRPAEPNDFLSQKITPAVVVPRVLVPRSFNLLHLKLLWKHWDMQKILGWPFACVCFACFFLAFAVKVPLVPFHTWLPHAHVQAPTAVSVVLAAVLLKLGVYGFLRISYPLFPHAAIMWGPLLGGLGTLGIIYAAWCALMQDDLKRLVAYSSVSHMGYCLLGLAALSETGVAGCVVQSFNHGIGAAMLFLIVGVLYDRTHHRNVNGYGGLLKVMPIFTAVTVLASLSSAGLPGLSGFTGEFLSLLGAAQSSAGQAAGKSSDYFRILAIIAASGVILTAAYLLWMLKRLCFGPLKFQEYATLPDLDFRESILLFPLAILTICLGVFPGVLLEVSQPAAEALVKHVWGAAP